MARLRGLQERARARVGSTYKEACFLLLSRKLGLLYNSVDEVEGSRARAPGFGEMMEEL